MAETVCPRCGHKNSFVKGFLPGTCSCKVCLSQLDWREIRGAGPDCLPLCEEVPQGNPCPDDRAGADGVERGAKNNA